MTTTQLYYLIKLSDLKSLSSTAIFFNLPYQNIARQLDNLEKEIGCKLLIKSAKGCTLTEAGKQVLAFAKATISSYTLLKHDLGKPTSIRMGVDNNYVHPKLVDYISDNPDLNVSFTPINYSDLADALLKNSIDCFLGYANIYPKTIDYIPISSDVLVVVSSVRHKLAHKKCFKYADFNDQTVFMGKFIWDRRNTVISKIYERTTNCNLVLNYDYFQLISKIFSGEALALIPKDYINILTAKVSFAPLENETLEYGLYCRHADELIHLLVGNHTPSSE